MDTKSKKEYQKEYYKKNCQKIKDRSKEYRKNNPNKIREYKIEYKKNHLGRLKNQNSKYRDKNIEKLKAYAKIWYVTNLEKVKIENKKYRENHKEEAKEYQKNYRQKYKNKLKEQDKEYYQNNKTIIKERVNLYRGNNKEKINKTKRKYRKYRHKIDPNFRLNNNMRGAIYKSLKGNKKKHSWNKLVGYDTHELKQHLEKQFKDGMTWENYGKGGWEIDHILPISLFNITGIRSKGFKACWALENLQPLWARENILKSNILFYQQRI